MGKAQRKRKLNKINQVVSQQRRHQRQQHLSTISALRTRFTGLDADQITSTKHPLESSSFMKNMLNPLQRAMVYCMNFCGGYATDDELEAFCSVYWKAIENASERRMGYAGLPNKRIFKIIFSIKKNGMPLFVQCPTDENKHGPYIPQQLFHDRLLDQMRIKPEGSSLEELTVALEPHKSENGFFIDLKSCERRVRAVLFLYKHQNIVVYDDDRELYFLKEHVQANLHLKRASLPKFLVDLNIHELTPGQLYDEIKKRKNILSTNINSNDTNESNDNSNDNIETNESNDSNDSKVNNSGSDIGNDNNLNLTNNSSTNSNE